MWSSPPTRDVDQALFEQLCRDLAERTRDFDADAVVGIATGGEVVARAMQPFLTVGTDMAYIRLQRAGTSMKSVVRLDVLLRPLPRRLLDVMRWIEVEYREMAFRVSRASRAPVPEPVDPVALEALEPLRSALRILVVDDTVDSGRTLRRALSLVNAVAPDAEVRTAVLTSTWRRPPVAPDYCLFTRTLLRMPWSFDAAAT